MFIGALVIQTILVGLRYLTVAEKMISLTEISALQSPLCATLRLCIHPKLQSQQLLTLP